MKKSVKATALILAFSVLLTGCAGSPASNKHTQFERTEKSDKVYQKAEITQVKDKEFSVSDKTGLYTGDWKGNRPEGEGTLVISEDEYYSGTWENGYLSGQGEIKTLDESGSVSYFKGECAYSVPSGQGQMTRGDIDSGTFFILDGSFDGESSLVYFMITENKLADIGNFINGDWISYVDNPDAQGMSFKGRDLSYKYGKVIFEQDSVGEYFGQLNENGIPDGYGYYRESGGNRYYNEVGILGSWKDGELDGYYTIVNTQRVTTTEYVNHWYGREEIPSSSYISTKTTGCKKNGQEVGIYTCTQSCESNPQKATDGAFTDMKNYDTGITMRAEHWINGTHIYEWRNAFDTEGEYLKFDSDWNITVHNITQDGKWTELVNTEKEKREAQQRLMDKCTKAMIIGFPVMVYIIGSRCVSDIDWTDTDDPILSFCADVRASCAFSAEMDSRTRAAAERLDNGDTFGAEQIMQEANDLSANYSEWAKNYKASLNNRD